MTITETRRRAPFLLLMAMAVACDHGETSALSSPANAPPPPKTNAMLASSPAPSAATKPSSAELLQSASRPSLLADTLKSLPILPELYDLDPGNLNARYAEKLVKGSLDAKNFAIRELGAAGEEAALEILRILEPIVDDPQQFGAISNCAQALSATKTKNQNAVKLLVRALGNPSGTARSDAARALGELKNPLALPALKAAFAVNELSVRKIIVHAIGLIDAPDADATLAEIAQSETIAFEFRKTAMESLAQRPIKNAEEHLRKCLNLPTPFGEAAAFGLVPTRDPEILKKVRAIAVDPTNLLCAAASIQLARIQDYSGAIHNLRSADNQVRLIAGLVSIREGVSSGPPTGESLEQVRAALRSKVNDADLQVRVESIRLLIMLGERPDLAADLENLKSNEPARISQGLDVLTDVMIADPVAVQPIIEKLEAAPLNRKAGYIQALGRLRDPRGVPALLKYLTGGEIQLVENIPLHEYAAIQLSNLGEAGFEALSRAIESEKDPERRLGLVRGLTYFTIPRDGVSALLRRVASNRSDHPEVRAIALRFIPTFEKSAGAAVLKRLLESEPDFGVRKLINWLLYTYY
ncbi:MAG: hypothetical protein HY286_20000 [Planctomycetes bacterium]|nr:hypothetical protein [Planctomycetota bacterium]